MQYEDKEQRWLCNRFSVKFVPSPPTMKVGIAENVKIGAWPLNGLRHTPERGTTGWYFWAGETFSQEPDFFQPLHAAHLTERCPVIIRYLGLPPGWRFLLADDHEDVWFDLNLLDGLPQ
jgi:hypothetical protein